MSLLSELNRRNVFRVAATYVIAAWLIVQVASTIEAPLSLPDWFDTLVVVLLAIGFPIAMVMAWAFELTPAGIKASAPLDDSQPGNPRSTDYVLIVALVVLTGVTVWDRLDLATETDQTLITSLPDEK